MEDDPDSRGTKPVYELPSSYEPLFTSNEPPLGHQVPEITQSATLAEACKIELDLEINQARIALSGLESLAFHATRHIERCRSLLSPIRRMPVEILSKIFTAYNDLLAPQSCDIKDGVWILGHICGHWRAVALSTPALWSSFSFRCDAQLWKHTALRVASAAITKEFLSRSSGQPLSIAFECSGGPFPGPCRAVFVTVLAHSQRWRSAKLHIPSHLHTELRRIKDNIPDLTRLRLKFSNHRRAEPVAFHDTETFRSCPRLVDLRLSLHSVDKLSIIDFPWHQLTRYSGPAIRGHTDVLASTPNLVNCTLKYDRAPFPQPTRPLVGPGRLVENLKLYDGGGPQPFIALGTLTLPALTHLCAPTTFAHPLAALVSHSHAALRVLEISAIQMSATGVFQTGVLALLEAAPGITNLTLAGPVGAPEGARIPELFRALILTPGAPAPILPNLACLALPGVVVDDALLDMLESRAVRVPADPSTSASAAKPTSTALLSVGISKRGQPLEHHLRRLSRLESQSELKVVLDFEDPESEARRT
ncbi:hypothetical protein C8R46DRAFT_1272446 [Mycena filopes]|nr:hypothetical protein C8R46DRAFT_1272446 [Mycena filopes]